MKNINSEKKLRHFGYIIGLGFPLIIGLLLPKIFGEGFRNWTFYIGVPFLFFGVFAPSKLYVPYKIWMTIGEILGWINSRIILGLVFLFVLQPIAFFMRLFGYDPLGKKKKNISSYREIRKISKVDLTRIF